MPAERFEIRIPASKLLIAMFVIIIPICLAALFSLVRTDSALERTAGAQFKTVAQLTASQIASFIHERVTGVRNVAITSAVVEAVAASNRKYSGRTDSQIADSFSTVEATWSTPAADRLVSDILAMPASQFLRKHLQYDPALLRVTVTDIRGAVVASTHKTVNYFQGDQQQWRDVYADGRGAVNITDVLYDDVTKSSYIGIGMPVLEEGTNRFIGALTALVDVSNLSPIVRQVQLGNSGRAMLVKDDGVIVAAAGVSSAAKMHSAEFEAIREALGTVEGRQTGFLVSRLSSGPHVIGFADTGLKDDYPKLGWVVLSVQDANEAFASIRSAERVMGLVAFLGLMGVMLFGVYVYLHRQPNYDDLAEVAASSPPTSHSTAA